MLDQSALTTLSPIELRHANNAAKHGLTYVGYANRPSVDTRTYRLVRRPCGHIVECHIQRFCALLAQPCAHCAAGAPAHPPTPIIEKPGDAKRREALSTLALYSGLWYLRRSQTTDHDVYTLPCGHEQTLHVNDMRANTYACATCNPEAHDALERIRAQPAAPTDTPMAPAHAQAPRKRGRPPKPDTLAPIQAELAHLRAQMAALVPVLQAFDADINALKAQLGDHP